MFGWQTWSYTMARISKRSTDGTAVRHAGGGVLARAGLTAVMAATLFGAAVVGFGSGVGLRWIGMLAKPALAADTVPMLPGCAKKFYDRAPGLPRLDNCLAAPQ